MRTVLVLVADTKGAAVSGAIVRVDDLPIPVSGTTDTSGACNLLVSDLQESHLWIMADGYIDYSHHLDLPTTNVQVRVGVPRDPAFPGEQVILPPIEPVAPPRLNISRLHVSGLSFYTETDEQWFMAFADGFRDYERFLNGEDIKPLLQQTVDLGGNGRRVFGSFDFGSPESQRLYPREHPDYYDRLPDFCELFAEYDLYMQFTAFADTQRSVPGESAQRDHWARVCDAVRAQPNVLLEFVNEQDAHENHANFEPDKPDEICASRGSNGGGSDPPGPYWDYADLHPERPTDPAKLRQSTTTLSFAIYGTGGSFHGTQRCTVASEPIGFADVAQPGRRVSDPDIAYLLGLGCRWGAGGTAHSDCGVASVLLTVQQAICVEAFLKGVRGG